MYRSKVTLEEKTILAEFVGFTYKEPTEKNIHFPHGTFNKAGVGHCAAKDLEFHKDWNYLMQAWVSLRRNLRDILDNGATQTALFLYDEILSAVGAGEIDYAYEKVLKGVKWWNQNK